MTRGGRDKHATQRCSRGDGCGGVRARLVLGALASRQKGLRADASVAAFCAICEHNIEH